MHAEAGGAQGCGGRKGAAKKVAPANNIDRIRTCRDKYHASPQETHIPVKPEQIVHIDPSKLHPLKNHPFSAYDDAQSNHTSDANHSEPP